jgi:hypothetical protein
MIQASKLAGVWYFALQNLLCGISLFTFFFVFDLRLPRMQDACNHFFLLGDPLEVLSCKDLLCYDA